MLKLFLYLFMTAYLLSAVSCKKYLEEKTNQKLAVPQTLGDLQALLDNYNIINKKGAIAGEISADDYYVTDAGYDAMFYESRRRLYRWEKEHVFENELNDWYNLYRPVYYANSVLDALKDIPASPAGGADRDNIRGQALFIRGYAFFEAAVLWAPAYDSTTANTALGIPLRLSPDFNIPSVRSTVAGTFTQVLADIKNAVPLLPSVPLHVLRPCKASAYGMLARAYLYLRHYDSALVYADKCLKENYQLMDCNTLDTSAFYPFPQFNSEVIYEHCMAVDEPLYSDVARIDSTLYRSYQDNDLRRKIYFNSNGDGTVGFRGSYEHGYNLFDGIALDEMYLDRAECFARQGDVTKALSDLNTLLASRWQKGTFVPVTAANKTEALKVVLTERRKELLMRGRRWTDLKRLNKEGAGITPGRLIHGVSYTLPPDDNRYALPIPDDIMNLSGMQQNP